MQFIINKTKTNYKIHFFKELFLGKCTILMSSLDVIKKLLIKKLTYGAEIVASDKDVSFYTISYFPCFNFSTIVINICFCFLFSLFYTLHLII